MTDDEILFQSVAFRIFSASTMPKDLIAFARAIEAAEREACAKLCEDAEPQSHDPWLHALDLATAIRSQTI